MIPKEKIKNLESAIEKIYAKKGQKLLFHGWHHISFVKDKALIFAKSIKANLFFVKSAALVHDLNYLVKTNSEPQIAQNYRKKILMENEYSEEEIKRIEKIVMESHTAGREENISEEGKALSDADTLFKALPITPILFTGSYIKQNKVDIKKLAEKIISEQNHLFNEGIYFYTDLAKGKYFDWAKINLALWNNVNEALKDKSISKMLEMAAELKML